MLDAIKQLLDSNVITEDTHNEIMEAWDSKLNEARNELRVELREEFAQRYDHDKKIMVEALDKMISEGLRSEIEEFREEKAEIANDRVKFKKSMLENAAKFNNFLTAKLAEEIKELRADRKKQQEGMKVLESFIAKHLTKEIREFAQDKKDVVQTKVRLVSEANKKLNKLKQRFIKESAEKVQKHVSNNLRKEITTLREDIDSARENNFGRKIFEVFQTEFASSFLNENAMMRKLKKQINKLNRQLTETKKQKQKIAQLTESKEKQIRMLVENGKRNEILEDLLTPLNKEKQLVMKDLLENVQTKNLVKSFEKYLPAVLSSNVAATKKKRKLVTEDIKKEVTGDKPAKKDVLDETELEWQKLAGIKIKV